MTIRYTPPPPDPENPRELDAFTKGLWGGFFIGLLSATVLVLFLDWIFPQCVG